MPFIPVHRRKKWKDQRFSIILSYIASSRTSLGLQKNLSKGREELKGREGG